MIISNTIKNTNMMIKVVFVFFLEKLIDFI